MVISVFLAAMWYILIIFGTSLGLSGEELAASNLATADAMKALYGGSDIASKLLICGGIAGILTSWNAFIMGGSRAVAAMAQEGMLPACLGKYHPKYKTPMNAIILLAVLNALAPLLGRKMMDWLVNAGGMATTMTYLLVSICFIKLRKRAGAPGPTPSVIGNFWLRCDHIVRSPFDYVCQVCLPHLNGHSSGRS